MKYLLPLLILLSIIPSHAQVMKFPSVGLDFQNQQTGNSSIISSASIKSRHINELLVVVKNTEDTTLTNLVGDSTIYQFDEDGILYCSTNRIRTAQLFFNETKQVDSIIEILSHSTMANYKQAYSYRKTDTGSIYLFEGRETERKLWFDDNNVLIRREFVCNENSEVYTFNPQTQTSTRTVFKNGIKRFELNSRWVLDEGKPVRFHASKKTFIKTPSMSPDYSGFFEVNADGKAILPRAYLSIGEKFNDGSQIKNERAKVDSLYSIPKSTPWLSHNTTFDINYVSYKQIKVYVKKDGHWQQITQL